MLRLPILLLATAGFVFAADPAPQRFHLTARAHEIDPREMPAGWTTGYIPLRRHPGRPRPRGRSTGLRREPARAEAVSGVAPAQGDSTGPVSTRLAATRANKDRTSSNW